MLGTRSRAARFSLVAATMLASSAMLLASAAHGRGAVATGQASSKVVVIPGFQPPTYPGFIGIPRLPVDSPELSGYQFTQLAVAHVTAAALAPYDTVILYGTRWSDPSTTAQAAINRFAQTGKVIIWDADDTGAQSYSTFIHPFTTAASGETHRKNDAVVSFPDRNSFLASDDPHSPYYLDPAQLVSDPELLNDMSVMRTGSANWAPALSAANESIPGSGWPLAWTYGNIGNQTGMTIYSGIDADAFAEKLSPNLAIKELSLQLAAPFTRTPTSPCGPSCSPPPGGEAGSGGGGSGGGQTYAACSFARRVPSHWVHREVPITLKTSVTAGIRGIVYAAQHDLIRQKHRVVAAAGEPKEGVLRLPVNTRWLRSNRMVHLQALVYVDGQKACSLSFHLKVDNIRPRLLHLQTPTNASTHVLTLEANESSSMRIVGGGPKHLRWTPIRAARMIHVRLPRRIRHVRLILRDRADNELIRNLTWG